MLLVQTARKTKQVEQRLGFHLGQDVTAHELVLSLPHSCVAACGYAMYHVLNACTQMAVDMVVEPDSIETTIDDIGGLDNILERLVS